MRSAGAEVKDRVGGDRRRRMNGRGGLGGRTGRWRGSTPWRSIGGTTGPRGWRTGNEKPSAQTTKHKDNKDDDPKSGGPKEAKESTSTLCGDTRGKGDGGGHHFYLFFSFSRILQ